MSLRHPNTSLFPNITAKLSINFALVNIFFFLYILLVKICVSCRCMHGSLTHFKLDLELNTAQVGVLDKYLLGSSLFSFLPFPMSHGLLYTTAKTVPNVK